MERYWFGVTQPIKILCRMRRKKASSARLRGFRLVEKMMSWSKGTPNCWPGVEAAEILAGFQGIHPAVEELPGGHLLAAEIVDDKDAVIGVPRTSTTGP